MWIIIMQIRTNVGQETVVASRCVIILLGAICARAGLVINATQPHLMAASVSKMSIYWYIKNLIITQKHTNIISSHWRSFCQMIISVKHWKMAEKIVWNLHKDFYLSNVKVNGTWKSLTNVSSYIKQKDLQCDVIMSPFM